jgi:hypothetical protein
MFFLFFDTKYAPPPATDTLVVTNTGHEQEVYFTCSGKRKSHYMLDDGSEVIRKRMTSNDLEISLNPVGDTVRLRWYFNSLNIACFEHTTTIHIDGVALTALRIDFRAGESLIAPDITLGDTVKTLNFIEMPVMGGYGIGYSNATVNSILAELTADPDNIQESGLLNLVGHSLDANGVAMAAILESKNWKVISYNGDFITFKMEKGAPDGSMTVYCAGTDMLLGDCYVAEGTELTTQVANPKWYGPYAGITGLKYANAIAIEIPAILESQLQTIEIVHATATNEITQQALLDNIIALDPPNMSRFTSLNSFKYNFYPDLLHDGAPFDFRFSPDTAVLVDINRIRNYTIEFCPRTNSSLKYVSRVKILPTATTGTVRVDVNNGGAFSEELALECESDNIEFIFGYCSNLILPNRAYRVSHATSTVYSASGILKNIENYHQKVNATFSAVDCRFSAIQIPETSDAWPLTTYNFTGNALTRQAMNDLVDYLHGKSWGSGKTFNLQRQKPYRIPGAAARAKIASPQMYANIQYDLLDLFAIELDGAGMSGYNSCFKQEEYDYSDRDPAHEYDFEFGRYFNNGNGVNIFELIVDRNVVFAGEYRYVIKAWIITTRIDWYESVGPSVFLNPSTSTYKIIEVYEQWQGSTKVAEISEPVRNAGSGMGAVPTLTLIN